MFKIIIADDHPLLREGLKKILSQEKNFQTVAEANNGDQLLKTLSSTDCDIVIVDLNMPGKHGLDLIKDIKAFYPKIKILVVSALSSEKHGPRLLKSGISGFMPKDLAADELIEAVKKISLGQKYITPSLADKLASSFGEIPADKPHEKLSDREFQILCLIAEGYTVHEISVKLSISISTINTYHSRICEKMDMKSNAELILYAIKNNLVE
ncbi:MAG TPA: response regulator transcription factor [Ignavibacteria bacterium]|nr:response regulator transcription factor [Ignavibacteria bacterium]